MSERYRPGKIAVLGAAAALGLSSCVSAHEMTYKHAPCASEPAQPTSVDLFTNSPEKQVNNAANALVQQIGQQIFDLQRLGNPAVTEQLDGNSTTTIEVGTTSSITGEATDRFRLATSYLQIGREGRRDYNGFWLQYTVGKNDDLRYSLTLDRETLEHASGWRAGQNKDGKAYDFSTKGYLVDNIPANFLTKSCMGQFSVDATRVLQHARARTPIAI